MKKDLYHIFFLIYHFIQSSGILRQFLIFYNMFTSLKLKIPPNCYKMFLVIQIT